MSVLRGQALKKALNSRVFVTPVFDTKQVGYTSINVRLGCVFVVSERTKNLAIDPRGRGRVSDLAQRKIYVALDREFVLHPRAFALAATLEYVALKEDVLAFIEGRSSPGRTGLLAVTAGVIHPGYAGCPTLELMNAGDTPIILRPGDLIAQLVFLECSLEEAQTNKDGEPAAIPSSRYQVSIEPEFSKWFADRETDKLVSALPARLLRFGDE